MWRPFLPTRIPCRPRSVGISAAIGRPKCFRAGAMVASIPGIWIVTRPAALALGADGRPRFLPSRWRSVSKGFFPLLSGPGPTPGRLHCARTRTWPAPVPAVGRRFSLVLIALRGPAAAHWRRHGLWRVTHVSLHVSLQIVSVENPARALDAAVPHLKWKEEKLLEYWHRLSENEKNIL